MNERKGISITMILVITLAILFIIFSSVWFWIYIAEQKGTTIILVRHAEVDYSDDPIDPDLTLQGEQRAEELAKVLAHIEVDTIYATEYKRTQQTAQPLATSKNLQIIIRNANDWTLLVNEVKQDHEGETILIVGHSNTVPGMVGLFAGQPATNFSIVGHEFYKIFIVSIPESGKPWAIELKYGEVPSS